MHRTGALCASAHAGAAGMAATYLSIVASEELFHRRRVERAASVALVAGVFGVDSCLIRIKNRMDSSNKLRSEHAGIRGFRRGRAGATLFATLLAACGVPQPPQALQGPPPAVVGSLTVAARDLPLSLEYPAQLRGVREVEVRARVTGILLERLYEEGSTVESGDVLFKIDPAPFRAVAERARAELDVRRADLRQAELERDRIEPLREQGVASVRDRDNALAAYEAARAAVAAAEAELRTAELELSYTDVRAPIAGVTSREVRSEGSLVTAGDDSSLLTYLVQTDRLYVEFALPDGEAGLVRAALAEDSSEVAVRVIGVPGAPASATARIEFIAPRVDDSTGTVAIRALLDNADGALLPGLVARARIEGVAVNGALVIPKRAVMRGAAGTFVWRIGDDGTVAPSPIELGASSGNDTAVVAGLASGDRIVVDGILKVQPGAPVNATPIDTASEVATPAARAAQ
jgi:membrane fusion protein, multidrug efflux system